MKKNRGFFNYPFSLITYRRAFTLIELLVAVAVIAVLYAFSFYLLRPEILKARARDAVRLSDLGKLQSALENYLSDNGVPPDASGLLRLSNLAVNPPASPTQANGDGWIGADLSARLENLPVDPLNTGNYVYRYKRVGQNYELDVKLENYTGLMKNGPDGDGGNSDSWLEKGTDLTILGD